MRFVERSKKLNLILKVINGLIGIYLGFVLYVEVIFDKNLAFLQEPEFLYMIASWLPWLLVNAILSCVIKDAQEDLSALKGLIENSKSE